VPPLQSLLDPWLPLANHPQFLRDDPLQFPHRFAANPAEAELVAFMAALLSYGQRAVILPTLETLFCQRMWGQPLAFITEHTPNQARQAFADFRYRFNGPTDLIFLCQRLQQLYQEFGSLEAAFIGASPPNSPLKARLSAFMDLFLPDTLPKQGGLKFLLAHPRHGGACKRLHMFLRWVVRKDALDLGLWAHALTPAQLIIPLDTHVAQAARHLKLTRRTANDWQTAEEITRKLARLCPMDPVRYDRVLFLYNQGQTINVLANP
jgi:uncharacterized protein (TIGR02757 family)